MGVKNPSPSLQLRTFQVVVAFLGALKQIGITTGDLIEIQVTGQELKTSYGGVTPDAEWAEDTDLHAYVTTFAGVTDKTPQVGLVMEQLGKGGLANFIDFYSTLFEDEDPASATGQPDSPARQPASDVYAKAVQAILALPGVNSIVNSALTI